MKKSFVLGIVVILLTAGAVFAAAVDVTGEWEITIKTPRGDRTSPIAFAQNGESLTATTTGRDGTEIKATGTVKGNDIEWSLTRTNPQGEEVKITYKGTIDGDKMSGTGMIGERSTEWSAVRKAK